ncbi:MAG: hypothetical protein AAFX55_18500 [Bacteroidota bacterium]
MSRKPDDYDLDVIHQIAKRSEKIQGLIDDKNKATSDINKTKSTSFYKPEPRPKPKGDIDIPKMHSKTLKSKEQIDKEIEDSEAKFDKKIKKEMINESKRLDYEEETINQIEEMNSQELSVLAEKGPEEYKNFQKTKDFENSKDTITIDERPISQFKDNKQDMELNHSYQDIDDIYNRTEYIDFDEESLDKDLEDIDKTPDPSDDFEK